MKLLRTVWMLTRYDTQTERSVAEYELYDFDEAHWLHLLGISPDGDILGGYEVRPEHVEFIHKYVPAEFDITEYDCFVELCGEYDWGKPGAVSGDSSGETNPGIGWYPAPVDIPNLCSVRGRHVRTQQGSSSVNRQNHHMDRLTALIAEAILPREEIDASKVLGDRPYFTEFNDCILLRRFASTAEQYMASNFYDRTGLECFVNHIHLSDVIANNDNGLGMLRAGLDYAELLATELRNERPDDHFTIIISYDLEAANDCVVRFHRTRPGEQWLLDDLDRYETDAVAEIKI